MRLSKQDLANTRQPYVRILALNGGGARCWSALLILEEVMKIVSRDVGNSDIRPCEYFHLIVGSEWGAVLAILLGRLRLSILECRQWLRNLRYPWNSSVFRPIPGVTSRRSSYYSDVFRELARANSPSKDAEMPFYDDRLSDSYARTVVLATDPGSLGRPKRFRSYMGADCSFGPPDETPMWKVALAAIATPLDLDPVVFPATSRSLGYMCIASSLAGYSNPSWFSLIEAKEHYGPDSVHSVFNIGCGGKSIPSWLPKLGSFMPFLRGLALARTLIAHANDANSTATQVETHRMMQESANSGFFYQYFSASAVDASYYDWSEQTRRQIEQSTFDYLITPGNRGLLDATAKQLVNLKKLRRSSDEEFESSSSFSQPPLIDISDEPSFSIQYVAPSAAEEEFSDYSRNNERRDHSSKQWFLTFKKCTDLVKSFDAISAPIRLAILDTGIDGEHPWIKQHWKYHSPSRPHFYDFITGEDSASTIYADNSGHGTHMAGIILQHAPHVDLYVIRVFVDRNFGGKADTGGMERVRRAILFAVDDLEVNIISMSFAFQGNSNNALDAAIARAIEKNVVMFAAASNDGQHSDDPYPASDRRVFRVNSVDEYGNRSVYNPPAGLDEYNNNLAIIGVNICSTSPMHQPPKASVSGREGNWSDRSGTSCSTALMSAVCALSMSLGRTLRGSSDYWEHSPSDIDTWRYAERPQGIRHLFWAMAGGRNKRTSDGFSEILPWRVISTDRDIIEIRKMYLDALQLAKEGMG